jgi:23S rRNA (uracil1939-C5)-methyltransferase
MAACKAVVLDPPYAGAAAQMRFIVAAAAPRIIYVSCNPDALARDAFLLHRAGYKLLAATPIDQFPYSENLESVVVFAK